MANSMQNDFAVGPKVVDAEKVETTQTARVNTDIFAQALQKIIGDSTTQQTTTINPAHFITEAGPKMKQLYANYEELRAFARHLNGLAVNDPLPRSLGFQAVELVYRPLNDKGESIDGPTNIPRRVKLTNVAFVGQLASLLSAEMGVLLFAIQKEIDALNDITTRTKEQITRARAAWAAANKDIKIEETTQPAETASETTEIAAKE